MGKNMMSALAQGGRMAEVFKVITMYSDLITMAKGDLPCKVTSAAPLSDDDKKGINLLLKQKLGLGANMSFETVVDPSLVSGFTIEVGDKFMDMSAATQLKKLQ